MVSNPLEEVDFETVLATAASLAVLVPIGVMVLLLAVLSLRDGRYVLPVAVGLLVAVMAAQAALYVRDRTA